MARKPRVVVPGFPHHVTQRGNRRQKTFFCDDDYRYYIQLLSESIVISRTKIWAYCLMPNHIHLIMVPEEDNGLRVALENPGQIPVFANISIAKTRVRYQFSREFRGQYTYFTFGYSLDKCICSRKERIDGQDATGRSTRFSPPCYTTR